MAMTGTQAMGLARYYVGEGPSLFYEYYSRNVSEFRSGDWCACFVSCVLKMAGATAPGFPGLYCPTLRNAGVAAGRAVPVSSAMPGDVVFFNWDGNANADHVGLCEGVSVARGTITTVDGNVSNKVGRRTRTLPEVMSVIRPTYAAGAATTATASTKLAEDGVRGKLTISAMQTALKKKGYYDRAVDGDFGRYTALALQKYLAKLGHYTRYVDGDFGYYSVVALQNWLRHLGYYPTTYVIDGDWGKYTTLGLQQALNAGKF